jgi:hypothetical protein
VDSSASLEAGRSWAALSPVGLCSTSGWAASVSSCARLVPDACMMDCWTDLILALFSLFRFSFGKPSPSFGGILRSHIAQMPEPCAGVHQEEVAASLHLARPHLPSSLLPWHLPKSKAALHESGLSAAGIPPRCVISASCCCQREQGLLFPCGLQLTRPFAALLPFDLAYVAVLQLLHTKSREACSTS